MTGGIGDDLLQLGGKAMRLTDGVMDAGRAVARQADELGQGAAFAAKQSEDLGDFYKQARALNFPDRVTNALVENLTPGRKIAIELSELSDGSLGLKRAARFFDDEFAYKHMDLKGAKSNKFGLLYDEDYVPHLSDPDIMAIIDDGRILSDKAALQVVNDLNFVARGGREAGSSGADVVKRGSLFLESTDPFQHSQRATFFTVPEASNYRTISDAVPEHGVAVFELDSMGRPEVYTVGGGDEYVDWATRSAFNEDLRFYPWASKNPGGNPALDWNSWYERTNPRSLT